MLHKHLEDAEEKGFRGTDTKNMPEMEMARPEVEDEEEADDDDLEETDREHLIKGDGFKNDSKDITRCHWNEGRDPRRSAGGHH